MTDINTPSGTLSLRAVDKSVNHNNAGDDGDSYVGGSLSACATAMNVSQAVLGSSYNRYIGVYEWSTYGNEQNVLEDENFIINTGYNNLFNRIETDPHNTVFVSRTNTSSTVMYYHSSDNWQTFDNHTFSADQNMYSLGKNGTILATYKAGSARTFMIREFNGSSLVDGIGHEIAPIGTNIYFRGYSVSEDGTRVTVGYNSQVPGSAIKHVLTTFELTGTAIGNVVGSVDITSYTHMSSVYQDGFNLNHEGDKIITVGNGEDFRYIPVNGSIRAFVTMDLGGEKVSSDEKVTKVYPQGKTYSIPVISFRNNTAEMIIMYAEDTGTAGDLDNMILHAKIPVHTLRAGATWIQPIDFSNMLVGGTIAGEPYVYKTSYTPLTDGIKI